MEQNWLPHDEKWRLNESNINFAKPFSGSVMKKQPKNHKLTMCNVLEMINQVSWLNTLNHPLVSFIWRLCECHVLTYFRPQVWLCFVRVKCHMFYYDGVIGRTTFIFFFISWLIYFYVYWVFKSILNPNLVLILIS